MSNFHDWKETLLAAAFFVGLGDAVEEEVEVEVGVAVAVAVVVAVTVDDIEVEFVSGIAMQIFTSKPVISILAIAISLLFMFDTRTSSYLVQPHHSVPHSASIHSHSDKRDHKSRSG